MSAISIIIPMYNVEKYLRRCLNSVKNQTFQDWIAICVDDGSPDKSGKIAEEYAKKDKRFIVIHKENGGLSDARNVGIKKVKSKYVMFLDSDDCIHPQTMEIVYNLAEQKNTDIVSFKYLYGDSSVNIPEWFNKKYVLSNIKSKITNDLLLCSTNRDKGIESWYVQQCFAWAHLYRFDFIKFVNFPKNIGVLEDFVFWSNILFRNPRACIIKTPLYSYTVNPGSILHTVDNTKSVSNLIAAISVAFNDMKKYKLSRQNQRRWKSRFMWDILSRVYVYANKIEDEKVLKGIKSSLVKLQKEGVFDNVPDLHALRYRRRILKFIGE